MHDASDRVRSRPASYLLRLGLMLALRYAPAPWPLKQFAIWLAQPKAVVVGVAVIPNAAGRMLLLRARYSGLWLLPGGAVHTDEDPRSGAVRECREELGQRVTVERLTGIYTNAAHREITFAFRCAPLARPPVLSEEHETFRYVPPEQVPSRLSRIVADALAGGDEVRMVVLPNEPLRIPWTHRSAAPEIGNGGRE